MTARVFGPIAFRAKVEAQMPPPGDRSPARLVLKMRDLIWDFVFQPIADGVMLAAVAVFQVTRFGATGS